jgi:hypothetical protein
MATDLPKPGEAAQAAFEAEQELSQLNTQRKLAKKRKDETRAVLDAILEDLGLNGIDADVLDEEGKPSGTRTKYYYVNKDHFDITNYTEVREWAESEDEAYIDPEPALRESLIYQECRRRVEEGLPLPPGITKRSEKELHKTTTK